MDRAAREPRQGISVEAIANVRISEYTQRWRLKKLGGL